MIGISLFSGAGGLDLGASQSGLRIKHCIEFDSDSCETLRLNHQFTDTQILQKDILEVDFRALGENLPFTPLDVARDEFVQVNRLTSIRWAEDEELRLQQVS